MKLRTDQVEPYENKLSAAVSDQNVFDIVQTTASRLGYPYCLYYVRMPLPISNQRLVSYDNYPSSKQSLDYLSSIDEIVATKAALGVHADGFPILDFMFQKKSAIFQKAYRASVRIDWAKSIYNWNGTSSLLILGRDIISPSEDMVPRTHLTINTLLESAHAKISGMLFKKMLPEAQAKISTRELDVLRWTGEGKTSPEIAQILGVSTPTVNFHIKRVVDKLCCTNKTQAAVKAVALGILNNRL